MYFLQKITEMDPKESVRIVEYKDIGKVSFIRKSSVRNLKITIKPFREVQVTVPRFVSFESAGIFVEQKQHWIRKSQARLSKYRGGVTVFHENTVFKTHDHILEMGRHEKSTIRTIIRNGRIQVLFPQYADANDTRIQAAARKAICAALRLEALRHLPDLTQKLAMAHGFQFRQVTLRNNKTRWGSCSRNNSISLNIHLMRLPEHLCEYIVLHELCHTVRKHHQHSFWQLLDTVTGGKAKQLDRELNNFSPEVW